MSDTPTPRTDEIILSVSDPVMRAYRLRLLCEQQEAALRREREHGDRLQDALQDLRDEQNGPPLETHTERWEASIAKADAALADHAALRAEQKGAV